MDVLSSDGLFSAFILDSIHWCQRLELDPAQLWHHLTLTVRTPTSSLDTSTIKKNPDHMKSVKGGAQFCIWIIWYHWLPVHIWFSEITPTTLMVILSGIW